jgi:hypothetical protein
MTSGATTGGTAGVTSSAAPASGNAMIAAALNFLAQVIDRARSGIPLTLDGQTVGDLIDRHAYTSAATATSGFVAQGSIG